MRKNVLPSEYNLRILVSVFLLAGCGAAVNPDNSALAPGTLRMISVERVEDIDAPSLLANGTFEEWHAGLPAPTGFRAPVPTAPSALVRDIKAGHLGATGYTARQTWTGLDAATSPEAGFSTTLDLAPNTTYRLEAIASATVGMSAAIGAVELGTSNDPRTLARSVVEVRGETPARFAGTFRTHAGGPVTLFSHAIADSVFPGTVTWSAWRLEESTESIDAINIADAPDRRLWVNQALDQIRGQVALYGGVTTWAETTSPNRKNAARILREEGPKGASILGYENYVSAKEELAWFEKYSAPALPDGSASARQAILHADRALNARGIQLVVVPVPERVQLYFDHVNRAASELPVNLSAHAEFVDYMLSHDVLVLDPAPMLWAMKSEGMPVYWRGDLEAPSATLHEIAVLSAPMLHAVGLAAPEDSRQTYTIKVDTIPVVQRLLPGLPAGLGSSVPGETHAVQSVRGGAGDLFQPAPESPVLVAGSLALLHQVRGASFAAHLSMALGFPVALPGKNMSDTEILGYLAGGEAPEMASTKIVVFCVPDSALSREGWKADDSALSQER